MENQKYKDTRTGEIVTTFNIMDIEYMEKVVTTNGDTITERDEKAKQVREALGNIDCTIEDIEDIIGDGDFADYI